MALPEPTPGLVLNYSYLWREEAAAGREEGVKDRPCVLILAVERRQGVASVIVLPITHAQPASPTRGILMPQPTKRRLGLDERASWIVTSEANRFDWPGVDLRPISRTRLDTFAFGFIPSSLLTAVRRDFLASARRGMVFRPS